MTLATKFFGKLDTKLLALLCVAALGALAILASMAVDRAVRQAVLVEASQNAAGDAAILAAGLRSELDKFSLLPPALANDPEVATLLDRSPDKNSRLNIRLARLAEQTGAAAIYLMDDNGLTLAASNWDLATSFVGSNYSFRRYFREAIVAGEATQFALGTVSRRPGLYIAQRVRRGGQTLGVVAVKVEFDGLEEGWRNATEGVFVTDGEGIILLASNEDWRFRTNRESATSSRDPEADRRQFGLAEFQPLDLTGRDTGDPMVAASLIQTRHSLGPNGWGLHLLVDPEEQVGAAVANGRLIVMIALLLAIIFAGASLLLHRRRQARAAAIIADRTGKLRDQLHQANRLATLGQITAGLGHEIRQPLAAARVYAENGQRLMEAGRTDEARHNFSRIVDLSDRIGKITDELRGFARRDASEPNIIALRTVVEGALLLLHDRFAKKNIVPTLPDAADLETLVRAEPVRLEQVLVNLLQNALDASPDHSLLAIELDVLDELCLMRITDSGTGIDPDGAERLFQPFATTKPDGLGLGLVISREIMRDLGGDLQLEPCDSGARFLMKIPRA